MTQSRKDIQLEREKKINHHTIASLIEAMGRVAVAREDDHLVPTLLQSYSSIDHQPLGASNA